VSCRCRRRVVIDDLAPAFRDRRIMGARFRCTTILSVSTRTAEPRIARWLAASADGSTAVNAVAMAGGFTYRARKNDFYIKRLDKEGKMVRNASLRPSSSCLESLFGLPPMSFSRIFRLSRSACVVVAADALAALVEGWFVILEVSGVGERAIS
jgi:hypothetical protein